MSPLALCLCTFIPPQSIAILFFGNSHTSVNDVPGLVRELLESDGSGRKVRTEMRLGGLLLDIWQNPANPDYLSKTKWDVVVLQGAGMSSSHKYVYSQEGGIGLAKLAIKRGARALLYAEWPRRDWPETPYILSVYNKIAFAAKGAEIVPVPQAWDVARKGRPNLDMWQPDGNHAQLPGSYLAACVIAESIAPSNKGFAWAPIGLDRGLAAYLRSVARKVTAPAAD